MWSVKHLSTMTTTLDLIQWYLEQISASPVQLNSLIDCYKLSHESRREWGFPIYDAKAAGQVKRFLCSGFETSLDPESQTCRCGKPLSLLDKDWYVDEAGCTYHWGKRSFCGGSENGLFSCCKGLSAEKGCVQSKYHVSGYKPMRSDGFAETQPSKSKNPSKWSKQWHFNSANVFALDCEMVYTTVGLEVARVSLITVYGNTVYDAFVQPPNTILDYNTVFSGITPAELENVTNTLSNARICILKLLNKDSILIGHGLENDLVGLHMLHDNLVDTSILYRHEKGYPYRHSLKTLAEKYLMKTIHSNTVDHDSVEDARISVALMLHRLNLDLYFPGGDLSRKSSYAKIPFFQYTIFGGYPGPFVSAYNARCVQYYRNPMIFIPSIVQMRFPKDVSRSPTGNCPTEMHQR